jgi:hypothetical protein
VEARLRHIGELCWVEVGNLLAQCGIEGQRTLNNDKDDMP